ncbi:MAG: NGG1p interacting factor NIF3 [Candidatus Marinimicrobia bacterium]|nr:NGG1p interacting factor NIF3 [Candidatus Neomarinimicrobiota bacterium]
MSDKCYMLVFYVPEENLETVLDAVFRAGAGKYKNYDRCAWTIRGNGRFRPLENSNPYLGRINEDTKVTEIKVECIVREEDLPAVKKALIDTHPYEEPAYQFIVTNAI